MIYRFYAVKHVPSGLYLPTPTGRDGRGGSHVEPSDGRPRLFPTERGAKNYLASWLRGKHFKAEGRLISSWDEPPEYDESVDLVPQPHRKREDMLVVTLILVPEDVG